MTTPSNNDFDKMSYRIVGPYKDEGFSQATLSGRLKELADYKKWDMRRYVGNNYQAFTIVTEDGEFVIELTREREIEEYDPTLRNYFRTIVYGGVFYE